MGRKILLVDDSPIDLEWFELVGRKAGHTVITRQETLGLLAQIRKELPDLVLLDVHMPTILGNVLCQMLKDNPVTRAVKIVLYSVLDEAQLDVMARECNADGYITKTRDVESLLNQIEEICRKPGPSG